MPDKKKLGKPTKRKNRGTSASPGEASPKSDRPPPELNALHRNGSSPDGECLSQEHPIVPRTLGKRPHGKTDGAAGKSHKDKGKHKKKKRHHHVVDKAHRDNDEDEIPVCSGSELVESKAESKTPEALSPEQSQNGEGCKMSPPPKTDAFVKEPNREEVKTKVAETENRGQHETAGFSSNGQRDMPSQADVACLVASASMPEESSRRDNKQGQKLSTAEVSSHRGLSSKADMRHIFLESPWPAAPGESRRLSNDVQHMASASASKLSSQQGLSGGADMKHIFPYSLWRVVCEENSERGSQVHRPPTSMTGVSSQRGLSSGADMGHVFPEGPWAKPPTESLRGGNQELRKASSTITPGVSSQRGLSSGADMGHVFKKSPWVAVPEHRSRRRAAALTRSTQEDSSSLQKSDNRPFLLKGMGELHTRWKTGRRLRLVWFLAPAAVVVLVLLTIIIVTYYNSGSAVPMFLRKYCTEDECHRATSYVASVINKSISACDDFYGRVCYRWTTLKENVSFVHNAIVSYYESLAKEVLTSNASKTDRTGSHVFVAVLKSCSDFVTSVHTVAEVVAKVKHHLGDSLPSLQTSWEGAVTLVVRLALKHGVVTVLGIGWEKMGTRYFLHLSTQQPLPDRLGTTISTNHYKKYVSEIVRQTVPNATDGILKGVLALDAVLTNITRKGPAVQEVYSSLAVIERLSEGLTADFWTRAINVYMPHKKVTSADTVLASGFDVIKDVLSSLKAEPLDITFAYLNLLAIGEVLRYDYFGRGATKPSDLTNICLQATQKVLTQTWSYVISSISRHEYQAHYLEELFKHMQAAVVEELRFSKWMDAAVHIAVKRRLMNSISYTFSEADRFPDTVDYSSLIIEGNDFVADYLTALAYETDVLLRSMPEISRYALLNELQLSGGVYFEHRDGTLIVPLPYTTRPIFYLVDGEQFYNFATLGVMIAASLAQAASSIQYSSQLQAGDSLRSLESATECYRRQFESSFLRSKLPEYLGNSIFVATMSVRAAYEKLKKYCRNNLSSTEFHVYWPRVQQLFFERYCLLSCGDETSGKTLSPLQRCVIPLLNMQEFAASYGCPNVSSMNPVSKCEPL